MLGKRMEQQHTLSVTIRGSAIAVAQLPATGRISGSLRLDYPPCDLCGVVDEANRYSPID